MRRRDFIALVGGAVAWPVFAHGQVTRVRRVCVLLGVTESFPGGRNWLDTFVRGLAGLGWVQDRNVQIDTRWSGGDADKIKTYAAELIALQPDVILVGGTVGLA